jgi:predicted nucleic acid-binding protein
MMAYLDANCVIYLVEQNPVWGPKIVSRMMALRTAGDRIAISDLTRTECLAQPFFTGNAPVVADYQAFFNDPDITVLPVSGPVCERAAQIRAASRLTLKVPDCLHLAAAIEHGCSLFLTNDVQLRKCTQIHVEILT